MELTSLLASTKSINIPFPGKEGFVLTIAYISKEQLRKIAEKSKIIGFDAKTGQSEETLDNDLFTKIYTEKSLTGWEGLKFEYLKDLLLINEGELPEEGFLEYTPKNAVALVTNSRAFDNWITSVMSDISLFNKGS